MVSDSYYWFYSANAQVFGGLIAILGVFTIYALESIDRSIEGGRRELVQLMKPLSKNLEYEALHSQIDIAANEIRVLKEQGRTDPRIQDIKSVLSGFEQAVMRKSKIMQEGRTLLACMLSVLAISIACLPFASSSIKDSCAWRIIFGITLLASIGLFAFVGVFMYDATKSDS
jgi:hypothetical protein